MQCIKPMSVISRDCDHSMGPWARLSQEWVRKEKRGEKIKKQAPRLQRRLRKVGAPNGNRTRVSALKGPRPDL